MTETEKKYRTAGFPPNVMWKLGKSSSHHCQKCGKHDLYGYGAHIISKSPTGPRTYSEMKEYKDLDTKSLKSILDKAENGLWLCGGCHREVDDPLNIRSYPVEKLQRWKEKIWKEDISPGVYEIRRKHYEHIFYKMIDTIDTESSINIKNDLKYLLNQHQNIYTLPEVVEYLNITLHDHLLIHYQKVNMEGLEQIVHDISYWVGSLDFYDGSLMNVMHSLTCLVESYLIHRIESISSMEDLLGVYRLFVYIIAVVSDEEIDDVGYMMNRIEIGEEYQPYIQYYVEVGKHLRTNSDPIEVMEKAISSGLDRNYVYMDKFGAQRN